MSSISSVGGQTPGPGDLFSRTDSDRSGGVSQAELGRLAGAIAEKSGISIDTGDEAFKGYDSDGNGSLSGEELRTVLDNSGFGPPRGMQGVPPPPPPPQQAAGSYSVNLSDSGQDTVAALVSSLQDLLDTLKSRQEAGRQETAPSDIFGKADTDRSGTLSKDELDAFAEALKETTGQTLDVSQASIKALDRNGDGELSPDEVDLRKTLSLESADLGGDSASSALGMALDQNWLQSRQGLDSGQSGDKYAGNSGGGTLLEQIREVSRLLQTLSTALDSGNKDSDSLFSIKS